MDLVGIHSNTFFDNREHSLSPIHATFGIEDIAIHN